MTLNEKSLVFCTLLLLVMCGCSDASSDPSAALTADEIATAEREQAAVEDSERAEVKRIHEAKIQERKKNTPGK